MIAHCTAVNAELLQDALITLKPTRVYYQVNRSMPMSVPVGSNRSLVLLSPVNDEIGRVVIPDTVTSSESTDVLSDTTEVIDITLYFPDLFDLITVHYIQLEIAGEPTGAAIVLQPMITCPTAKKVYLFRGAKRISGLTYEVENETQIPAQLQAAAQAAGITPEQFVTNAVHQAIAIAVGKQSGAAKLVGWIPAQEKIHSGFRVYVEQNAQLHTTMGDITLMLRSDEAPNTAWNFRQLIVDGFYTDIPFHRVVANAGNGHPFVIQGGDPSATGSGGCGYEIDFEASTLPHDLGVVSMARESTSLDSGSSQFFLCLSREGTSFLDGQYATFGQTIAGIEVVTQIGEVPTGDAGKPIDMPYIIRAGLVPAEARIAGDSPSWIVPPASEGLDEE